MPPKKKLKGGIETGKKVTVRIEKLEKDKETLGFVANIHYGILKNAKVSSDTLAGVMKKVAKKVGGIYGEVIFVIDE